MLLKNFYKCLYPMLVNSASESSIPVVTYDNNIYTNVIKNGGIFKASMTVGTIITPTEAYNSNTKQILLGSGDTAPTMDDYCLEQFIPNMYLVSYTCTNDKLGNLTISAIIRNDNAESVTVKEIGYIYITIANPNGRNILIYRDVLSTPVTIAPSEQYNFVININGVE